MLKKFVVTLFLLHLGEAATGQGHTEVTAIREDLVAITAAQGPRNAHNLSALNAVARYVHDSFLKETDAVAVQSFMAGGKEYKNIIASCDTAHR